MKTVFITGATSGIGESCAHIFARNGYQVVINGRNSEKLHTLHRTLTEQYNASVHPILFDVRKRAEVEKALGTLPDAFRSIDILINNAGLVLGVDKEYEGSLDDWDIVLDTNIKGLLTVTRLIVPEMVKKGKKDTSST